MIAVAAIPAYGLIALLDITPAAVLVPRRSEREADADADADEW